LARLVEMRYFGGMTAEETAETLASPYTPSATICATPKRGCDGSLQGRLL